jgi:hypothetical protein
MPATIATLEDAFTDADVFETFCQIRGDELDGAGTHERVHHIRLSIKTRQAGPWIIHPVQAQAAPWRWNGNSSTLTRSRISTYVLPHLAPMVLRAQLRFAQTYASCIDQPCMHFFFALSAAMSFVEMGAVYTNVTCATLPSPVA